MKKLRFLNSRQKFLFIILFLVIILASLFSLEQIFTNDYISLKRKLEEKQYNDSEKFCSRASKELNNYYSTGDLSKLDLDDITINQYNEIKNSDNYNKAIEILEKYNIYKIDYEKEYQNNNNNNNNDNDDYNSIYSELKNTISFSLVISFISAVGYIFCLFNACCKCCFCCRCCKEYNCIKPCFIIFYFSFIIIILTSIFSFFVFSKIEKGFVNTECSYLKFYENILYGEKKQTNIKWIGVSGVKNILNNLYFIVNNMDYNSRLIYYLNNINKEKDYFFTKLKNVHKNFYEKDEITPLEGYCINYPDNDIYYIKDDETKYYLRKQYVLDIVPLFGKYHIENESFSGYISYWNDEFEINNNGANASMNKIQKSVKNIVANKMHNFLYELKDGISKLINLENSLEVMYKNRTKSLNNFDKKIGNKPKLFFILFFLVLILFCILLPILTYLFHNNKCNSRCGIQFGIHITWNILAIFMIISLFLEVFMSNIYKIGEDMITIISFVVYNNNFENINREIIPDFKKGYSILKESFFGEGNLTNDFNLNDLQIGLDTINQTKKDIKEYLEKFQNISMNFPAYHTLKLILENKTEFINDSYLYQINDNNNYKINFNKIIKLLNDSIGSLNSEKWNQYQGDTKFECINDKNQLGTPKNNLLHPWICEPIDRNWIKNSNNEIKNYAKIVSDIIDLLKYANGTKNPENKEFKNYYEILDELKNDYEGYLNTSINALKFFYDLSFGIINAISIKNLDINEIFSIMDGKFIKNDFKIVSKYLKETFGLYIFIMSICFLIIGCSLIISIFSTLLLLTIINNKYNEKKSNPNILNNLIINPNINNQNINNINQDMTNYNIPIKNSNINSNQSEVSFVSNDKIITKEEKKYYRNYNKNKILNIDLYDAETIKSKINLLDEEAQNLKLKLKINAIFFYESLSKENVDIYNRLKLVVLGGFFGVQNIDVFKKLLIQLENLNTSFILISTGSSFQKVDEFCLNLNCIKQVIIFCADEKKYKSMYDSKKKNIFVVTEVLPLFVYLGLHSELLPDYDKNIKKLINHNPQISYFEYEKYYYIYHKMLSFFFKEDFSILNYGEDYLEQMFEFIEKNTELDEDKQNEFKNIIIKFKNSDDFLKESLVFYTSENEYVYLFNKAMRKIEEGLERLSFLMGPMYYSMVRYLKVQNPNLNLNESMILYRNITINKYDLNIYSMAVDNIICFSSFTSTSLKKNNFSTTINALKANKLDEEKINLLMILNYNHLPNNPPMGMKLSFFSAYPDEEEILLFPFTFIKVQTLNKIDDYHYELECDIINKSCILEYGLKKGKKVRIDNNLLITE